VGPRVGLDAVVKRKVPSPRRESNPRTPIVQPVGHTDMVTVLKQILEAVIIPTDRVNGSDGSENPRVPFELIAATRN
jgi:hypothetical protein